MGEEELDGLGMDKGGRLNLDLREWLLNEKSRQEQCQV